MATQKLQYGTSTAITCPLGGLASGSAVQSAGVSNATVLALDAMVSVEVTLAASPSPSGDKAVYIYVGGSENGTDYTDNLTGTAGTITLRTPTNLILIGVLSCPTANIDYVSTPMSVAAAFGGILPRAWALAIKNSTGVALQSTGNAVRYTSVLATVV